MVLALPPLDLDAGTTEVGGLTLRVALRVFDFGAVSVRFALEIPPGTPCAELVRTVARIEGLAGLDAAAREVWARVALDLRTALRAPHDIDLVEDYVLVEVRG